MNRVCWLGVALLIVVGCGQPAEKPMPSAKSETEVAKALAKLPPDVRQRAEAQRKCPVSGQALGSMDAPVEIKVEGESVFICCEHCRKSALKDPQKTLARVKELKGEK